MTVRFCDPLIIEKLGKFHSCGHDIHMASWVPPYCLTTLWELLCPFVYNLRSILERTTDRYVEMHAIRLHIVKKEFNLVQ